VMGSGGSKAHQAFAVTPAATLSTPAPPAAGPDPAGAAELAQVGTIVAGVAQSPSAASSYAAVCAAVDDAKSWLSLAAAAGAGPEELAEADASLKAATRAFLAGLDPVDLRQLAHDNGLAHPHLVGLSGGGMSALVHYLDPAYPPGIPSKAAIAAKADERYAQLAAGAQVGGLTFAQVQALEVPLGAGPPGGGPGTWLATPAEVLQAAAALTATHTPPTADGVAALLAAENRLHTAVCPAAAGELAQAQGLARAQVDAVLTGPAAHTMGQPLAQMLAEAQAAGELTDSQHALLSRPDQVALLRASTNPQVRQTLEHAAAGRAATIDSLAALRAAYAKVHPSPQAALGLAPLPAGDDGAAVTGFAQLAGQLYATRAKLLAELPVSPAVQAYVTQHTGAPVYHEGDAGALTASFKTWQKPQPLPALRQAAAALGLEHADTAARADIAKYVTAQWGAHDPAAVQNAVSAKHTAAQAAKHAPTPKPPPAAGSPPASPPTPGTAPHPGPTPAGWAGKQAALVAALRHHAATAAAVPPRHDPATVAGWTFTPTGSAAHLGGVHGKQLVAAPNGSTWLFKQDTSGVRPHAERAVARR
jgi:hypothetical protein